MKIKLIAPAKKPEWREDFWSIKTFLNLTNKKAAGILLALPTLAALTPSDIEVTITDENVEPIEFEEEVDLVGISFLTCLAPRAYEIADIFRSRRIPVVLGGIHASMLPKEAMQHADSVLIGEAEGVWQKLIEDLRNSRLQQFYDAPRLPSLESTPVPRWDLLKTDAYVYFTVQTGRGCPNNCNFCSVTAFNGHKYRHKPIENVVRELEVVREIDPKKLVFFADDNFVANPNYAKKLLESIQSLGIRFWCQASMNTLSEDLLDLMYSAGCRVVFIGFESVSQESLHLMRKEKVNQTNRFKQVIEGVHSRGMAVFGSFVLGNDNEGESIFRETSTFINEACIPFSMINILTPFPGTDLARTLNEKGRIIHANWQNYDAEHVCFRPKSFSTDDLENGRLQILQETNSYRALADRLQRLWKKGVFVRSKEGNSPLLTKGRILFTLKSLTWGDAGKTLFALKSLWNPSVTSASAISLALNFHDYAYSARSSKESDGSQ